MRYLLFLWILSCFACDPPVKPLSETEQMAKSLCACTEQLLALNQQTQTSSDSLAFRQIAEEYEKARACIQKIGLPQTSLTTLEPTLSTHCPALATQKDLLTELLAD
jgi:hypothetical protein